MLLKSLFTGTSPISSTVLTPITEVYIPYICTYHTALCSGTKLLPSFIGTQHLQLLVSVSVLCPTSCTCLFYVSAGKNSWSRIYSGTIPSALRSCQICLLQCPCGSCSVHVPGKKRHLRVFCPLCSAEHLLETMGWNSSPLRASLLSFWGLGPVQSLVNWNCTCQNLKPWVFNSKANITPFSTALLEIHTVTN